MGLMLTGLRLYGALGLAAAIALLLGFALHWRHQAADRKASLETICAATRQASNVPNLKCSEVQKQIGFMGETITTLSTALDKQNAAVKALGQETARQQAEAAKASENAQERARGAEATAERLRASARALPSASQRQCEPSKALTEAWK